MKKTLLSIFLFGGSILLGYSGILYAQNAEYHIIPELEADQREAAAKAIEEVGKTAGKVMDTYRDTSETLTLPQQMATGIMNRNTLLDYVVYLIKFVSQIGLVIGALMIILAGYKYATSVFGGKTTEGNNAVKFAIIGVLVISFSYAIMTLLTSAFLGT